MHFDFDAYLGTVTRTVSAQVREGTPTRAVTLERAYDTTAEDLWDAVTNPERLPRWFLPVTGDLTLGGRYQLEGNAGGTITECIPPRSFSLTWEFGGAVSWVDVQVIPDGTRSRLKLSHIAPVDDFWQQYGPGAAGVGWDLGLIGLTVHLTGADPIDEEVLSGTAEGRAYIAACSEDWGRAAVASGEDPAWAKAAAKLTTAFYTGAESQES